MSLSSLGLDAFFHVAKTGSFTQACKQLHVTQSALSQRIKNLEVDLKATLFIRDKTGVRLTPTGEKLVRYCQVRSDLEKNVLSEISDSSKDRSINGSIRIAGFSTILRSVVMPVLSPLVCNNPEIGVEFLNRELGEIPGLLKSGSCDLAFTYEKINYANISSTLIGEEESILVSAASNRKRGTCYIDHDPEDSTTLHYFGSHGKSFEGNRSFLDEIYTVLDGVTLGWGRAVVPRHLLKRYPKLKPIKGFRPVCFPVYLSCFDTPFQTRALKEAIRMLHLGFPDYLKKSHSHF